MSKSMYDIIKKQNGEHFAKAIRNYDNGIFDIPNIDKIVKYAGRDAEPILNYLISLKEAILFLVHKLNICGKELPEENVGYWLKLLLK